MNVIHSHDLFSQESGEFYFFSSGRIFKPLDAGIFESRIGVIKFTGRDELRLDIGASPDIIGYETAGNSYSFGVDFFTFSSLRSEKNFKFPVDAIDYLFGINFNGQNTINENFMLSGRVRISHVSAHLQDGHIYESAEMLNKPFTYSREFIEVNLQAENNLTGEVSLKNQLGLNYIFHSIPGNFSRLAGQYGFEWRYILGEIFSLYLSDEVRVEGTGGKTFYNNNLETGITIGSSRSRAINLFFNYYDGQDYRGQYYGRYFNYKGIGFNLKL